MKKTGILKSAVFVFAALMLVAIFSALTINVQAESQTSQIEMSLAEADIVPNVLEDSKCGEGKCSEGKSDDSKSGDKCESGKSDKCESGKSDKCESGKSDKCDSGDKKCGEGKCDS